MRLEPNCDDDDLYHKHKHTRARALYTKFTHVREPDSWDRAASLVDWSECQCRKLYSSSHRHELVALIWWNWFVHSEYRSAPNGICVWLSGFAFYCKCVLIIVAQKTKTRSHRRIVTILSFKHYSTRWLLTNEFVSIHSLLVHSDGVIVCVSM